MDKTYKCPCCGSEIKLLIEKGFDRVKNKPIYEYTIMCHLYSCNMPFFICDLSDKPDDKELADSLFNRLVLDWEDWKKTGQLKEDKNDT